MRRLQDIDPPAAKGRPARGGPGGQLQSYEETKKRPSAPGSLSATSDESGPDHATGEESDLEKYLVHIAHLDLALSVKIALISALRDIMQSFVDRAFGDDPVQQMRNLEGHADDRKANEGQTTEDKSRAKGAHDSMAVLDSPKPEKKKSKEDKTSSLRGINDAGGGKR